LISLVVFDLESSLPARKHNSSSASVQNKKVETIDPKVIRFTFIIWIGPGSSMFCSDPLQPKTLERCSNSFTANKPFNQLILVTDFRP